MHKTRAEAITTDLGEGVTRRLLINGGKMMAVEMSFEPGAEGKPHSHPHEQVGVFLSGKFELAIGDNVTVAVAGDSYYVPPDTVHGVVCLEAGAILDVFTPQREDFLP